MRRSVLGVVAAIAALVSMAGGANALDYYTNNGLKLNAALGNPAWGTFDIINSMTGESYADVMGTSITIQREFRKALPSIYSYSQTAHYQDRADAGVSGEGYASVGGSTYVYCPTTMCAPGKKWVMWDVPFYMNEKQKRTDGALGYSGIASGFATGLSRMLGESSAIGLAVGYDQRRLTPYDDGYHFRNKADTLHTALYGGTNIGSLFLDAYAGWSRSWNRTERAQGNGTTFGNTYKANFHDDVYSAGLKASYVWILANDARITPSLGVDFSHVRMSAVNERHHSSTGVGVGTTFLRGDKSDYTNVAIPLMVSANKTFSCNFLAFKGAPSLWTPEVRAGYVPVIGKKRAGVDMTMPDNGNPTWNTTSAKFAGSYGTVGAGLKMKLADKYIFAVDYDYTFGNKYRNHSLTAMYGVSF